LARKGEEGIGRIYRQGAVLTEEMSFFPAAPNPFNLSTTLSYFLSNPGWITIKIMDMRVKNVMTLAGRFEPSGHRRLQWQPQHPVSGNLFMPIDFRPFCRDTKTDTGQIAAGPGMPMTEIFTDYGEP
jgi:hypothetical protein